MDRCPAFHQVETHAGQSEAHANSEIGTSCALCRVHRRQDKNPTARGAWSELNSRSLAWRDRARVFSWLALALCMSSDSQTNLVHAARHKARRGFPLHRRAHEADTQLLCAGDTVLQFTESPILPATDLMFVLRESWRKAPE